MNDGVVLVNGGDFTDEEAIRFVRGFVRGGDANEYVPFSKIAAVTARKDILNSSGEVFAYRVDASTANKNAEGRFDQWELKALVAFYVIANDEKEEEEFMNSQYIIADSYVDINEVGAEWLELSGAAESWYKRIEPEGDREFGDKIYHREGDPAIRYFYTDSGVPTDNISSEGYYINGQYHREDGPANISYYENGNIRYEVWVVDGVPYRENGPSVIIYYENGNKSQEYYLIDNNNSRHREDGPAQTNYYENGNKKKEEYLIDNALHRVDGPAVIDYSEDGTISAVQHFISGDEYTDWPEFGVAGGTCWDAPSLKVYVDSNGMAHRVDGPAQITDDYEVFFLSGTEYRRIDDGVETVSNGGFIGWVIAGGNADAWFADATAFFRDDETLEKIEFRNAGDLHREDGAAVIEYDTDGETIVNNDFYVNGVAIPVSIDANIGLGLLLNADTFNNLDATLEKLDNGGYHFRDPKFEVSSFGSDIDIIVNQYFNADLELSRIDAAAEIFEADGAGYQAVARAYIDGVRYGIRSCSNAGSCTIVEENGGREAWIAAGGNGDNWFGGIYRTHREDGTLEKEEYRNGSDELHREDGAALIEYDVDGTTIINNDFYLNGKALKFTIPEVVFGIQEVESVNHHSRLEGTFDNLNTTMEEQDNGTFLLIDPEFDFILAGNRPIRFRVSVHFNSSGEVSNPDGYAENYRIISVHIEPGGEQIGGIPYQTYDFQKSLYLDGVRHGVATCTGPTTCSLQIYSISPDEEFDLTDIRNYFVNRWVDNGGSESGFPEEMNLNVTYRNDDEQPHSTEGPASISFNENGIRYNDAWYIDGIDYLYVNYNEDGSQSSWSETNGGYDAWITAGGSADAWVEEETE